MIQTQLLAIAPGEQHQAGLLLPGRERKAVTSPDKTQVSSDHVYRPRAEAVHLLWEPLSLHGPGTIRTQDGTQGPVIAAIIRVE